VVDFLFAIIEHFSLSLIWFRRYEQILIEVCVFTGGGSLLPQISGGRKRCPPTPVGVRKLEDYPFVCYQDIGNIFFRLSQITRVTDRQTK